MKTLSDKLYEAATLFEYSKLSELLTEAARTIDNQSMEIELLQRIVKDTNDMLTSI